MHHTIQAIDKNMFLKSLKNAVKGIYYCINSERNFRVHTVAMLYVLVFSRLFNFSKTQYCILFLTIALVLIMECINTAIEKVLDFTQESYSAIIKIVKDVSAGAVLLSAICATCVGINLFYDAEKWFYIFNLFSKNISLQVLLIVSVALSLLYIKGTRRKIIKGKVISLNKKKGRSD